MSREEGSYFPSAPTILALLCSCPPLETLEIPASVVDRRDTDPDFNGYKVWGWGDLPEAEGDDARAAALASWYGFDLAAAARGIKGLRVLCLAGFRSAPRRPVDLGFCELLLRSVGSPLVKLSLNTDVWAEGGCVIPPLEIDALANLEVLELHGSGKYYNAFAASLVRIRPPLLSLTLCDKRHWGSSAALGAPDGVLAILLPAFPSIEELSILSPCGIPNEALDLLQKHPPQACLRLKSYPLRRLSDEDFTFAGLERVLRGHGSNLKTLDIYNSHCAEILRHGGCGLHMYEYDLDEDEEYSEAISSFDDLERLKQGCPNLREVEIGRREVDLEGHAVRDSEREGLWRRICTDMVFHQEPVNPTAFLRCL
ncbi:hypothetical protein BDK51DRAFT_40699 [Blyttiomyces helicus]|uniref:F-box domain-containing protein n=1 Tax=Blyttiomyces helicus TaxID=388810 RepID=A0A4P9WB52_9FUNG|nr:hypothetical protein BDK51DRAFT_40699 [Blyttiomyces helicus]|eukprot:RKO89704.1 hypothetical protein BDK51DRAFT_40699 [Blyttiomyces helicus]